MLICALNYVGEESIEFSLQGLCCGLLFFSGDDLVLSAQGSVHHVSVLQSSSGEALSSSSQGFVLCDSILLVVMILHCLYKHLCSGALFYNLLVVGILHCLCKAL